MLTRTIVVMSILLSLAKADKSLPGPEEILRTAGVDLNRSCKPETLSHPNPFVREASAKMCGKLRERAYTDDLRRMLENDTFIYARIAAGTTLLVLGDDTVVKTLDSLASGESISVGWDVVASLAAARQDATALGIADDLLRKTKTTKELNRCILALEDFSAGPETAKALVLLKLVYARATGPDVQNRVIEALGRFPETVERNQLVDSLLRNEEDPVKRAGLRRLVRTEERF